MLTPSVGRSSSQSYCPAYAPLSAHGNAGHPKIGYPPRNFYAGFCRRLTVDTSAAMSTGAIFPQGLPIPHRIVPLRSRYTCARLGSHNARGVLISVVQGSQSAKQKTAHAVTCAV